MKKYRLGVIGLGMGSTILEANMQGAMPLEVTGICDTDMDKLEGLKLKYGIGFITTDYRKLIDKPDIDIIAVFSPDHLHATHCLAALEKEKHIICTKPMVTSIEDAKKIVSIVREKKLKFLVGQTMRYEPQFTTIKKLYDDGDLGEIIMAEAHYVHDMRPVYEMTPWRLSVPQDLMYGGVCHPVDVLRWFLGDVDEVHAFGNAGNISPSPGIKNNFILNLKFKNKAIARILGAYSIVHPPMPMMGVSIFGTGGSAIGSFSDKKGGQVKVVLDKFEMKNESVTEYPAETEGAYGHGETVLRYLEHFSKCLNENTEPIPNAVEGAKSIAVCHAAWESVNSGRPVKVFNEF